MSVQEIELAIQRLAPAELARLSAWFADFKHERWDAQLAGDLESGLLDHFLHGVEREYQAGHAKPL